MDDITPEEAEKINQELAQAKTVRVGGFQIGVSADKENLIFRLYSQCPRCAERGEMHEIASEFMCMDIETSSDFCEAMRLCLKSIKQ